ncbi:MAG: hypothetical protein LBC87_10430 [Fibromonadaceae bacterium]|nr:hypothetical protein [Fibromonadaceae bacterium]
MKNSPSKLALMATLTLALTFTFSCSGGDNGGNDNGGGNGGSTEQSYNYCITADNICLVGPYTASICRGQVSNSCPNGSSPSVGGSSSSIGGVSSSSVASVGSSSSVTSSSSPNDIGDYCNWNPENCGYDSCCFIISDNEEREICRLYAQIVVTCPKGGSSSSIANVSSSSSVKASSSSSVGGVSSSSVVPNSSSAVYSSSGTKLSSSSIASAGGSCDIKDYRIVKIGNQTWMAENLNCDVAGSKCYDNNPVYCDNTYGRLYNWATAMTVCPSGWHLPSHAEWEKLISYVMSDNNFSGIGRVGEYLKAQSGWAYSNDYYNVYANGNDKYGFSALPGGACIPPYTGMGNDSFQRVGESGGWWSTLEYSRDDAYARTMSNTSRGIYEADYPKNRLLSVRCVQN